jgi:hypothetical protein
MNQKQKRVLEIGSDLLRWGLEFAKILRRTGEVYKMPDISDFDKQTISDAAKRLSDQFAEVLKVSDSQPTADATLDHLIASYDRLCEEAAKLNQDIDRLLSSRKA